jgi:hypothetical protein
MLLSGDRVAVKEEYAEALPAKATKAKPETFIVHKVHYYTF